MLEIVSIDQCPYLAGGFEGGGDHRPWGLEQRGEKVVEVEAALPCGADDAGEDLLGLRAPLRAIAATDFAIDHGGPDGVLGPLVPNQVRFV